MEHFFHCTQLSNQRLTHNNKIKDIDKCTFDKNDFFRNPNFLFKVEKISVTGGKSVLVATIQFLHRQED